MNVLRQFISPSFWWSVIWRSVVAMGAIWLTIAIVIFAFWLFLAHPGLL